MLEIMPEARGRYNVKKSKFDDIKQKIKISREYNTKRET